MHMSESPGEKNLVTGRRRRDSRQTVEWNKPLLVLCATARRFSSNLMHMASVEDGCKLELMPGYTYYRKRGSASYIVREVLSVRERDTDRERERDRERRKWRHHCRAKIGDEFTLSHAKNSHNWRWAYTFPCQKFALFVSPFTLPVSPFTERSPLWRWNSQRVHTFHCQKNFRPLCSPSFKWHEPRDEWSKTQDNWSNPAQSYFQFFPSKNWIKLIPKTIGNRKRDCAWGGSGW